MPRSLEIGPWRPPATTPGPNHRAQFFLWSHGPSRGPLILANRFAPATLPTLSCEACSPPTRRKWKREYLGSGG
jgi:hypothetical protein